MKKRILAIVMLLALTLTIFACKKEKNKEEATTVAPDKAYNECVTLGTFSYDIGFDYSKLDITEDELNVQINDWLNIFGEYKVNKEKAVEKKGYLVFDLEAVNKVTSEVMPKLEKINKAYILETTEAYPYIKHFENEFIGLKAGDDKKVTVTYPDDFSDERVKGRTIEYSIHVDEVYELIPAKYDEEFLKAFGKQYGYENLTKEKFEEELKKKMTDVAKAEILEGVMKKIEEAVTVNEYPAGELSYHTVRIKEEIEAQYEYVKSTSGMAAISRQDFLDNVYPGCIDSKMIEYCDTKAKEYLKTKMALILALEKEGITVTDAERDEKAKEYLDSTYTTIEKLYEYYGEHAKKQISYDVYQEKAEKLFYDKVMEFKK